MSRRKRGVERRRSGRAWLLFAALAGAAAACVTTFRPPESAFYHRTAAVPDAEKVGADECLVCHEEVLGHAPAPAYHADCESCHGPGSLHADSGDTADIRFPSSQDCLACHEKGHATHLAWSTSDHARAGVLCSDCHDPHNRETKHVRKVETAGFRRSDAATQLCASCHPDVALPLTLPSHHPVREGMMSCTDCHQPHADSRTLLGMRTSLCAKCHQDHMGPWIYEHPPVAEDCTICHNPHGSASYNLLATSQPALCLSCHSTPDNWHLAAGQGLPTGAPITGAVANAFYTRCSDCHGAVHGSYQDPHLRR